MNKITYLIHCLGSNEHQRISRLESDAFRTAFRVMEFSGNLDPRLEARALRYREACKCWSYLYAKGDRMTADEFLGEQLTRGTV